MPTNLYQTRRAQKLISTLVAIQVTSFHLSQHVGPDVKGNVVEGRGSTYNRRYTTSPNLILQQMAKCNLWP